MDDLQKYTDDDLTAEIERRKQARLQAEEPKPLDVQDGSALTQMCIDHVKEVWAWGWHESDWTHYIYEAALEAVFGKDIFDRLNRRDSELNG